MKVIGIDPGTRCVGFGIIEQCATGMRYCDSGTIECAGDGELAKRLVGIHRALQTVMREWQPEIAAVETVFFGKNSKTAIKIGEGRGVALLSAAEADVTVVGYEPAMVKKSLCGNGRASKRQIQLMVKQLLALPEIPQTDHEADALALAICHLSRARFGLAGNSKRQMPAAVAAILAKSRKR